jgi:hypothetical protein
MTAAETTTAPAPVMRIRELALVSSVLRPVLWLILVGLTVALLAYPRQMAMEYSPIQSLDAVEPVPVFASLYYAWMATLVSLILLLTQGRASHWQGLALVAVFVLVYRGFWDIPFAAVKHVDNLANAGTAEYIRSAGEIPFGNPNVIYVDYPGLHTLTAALAIVTGLATADAVRAMVLLMDLLMAGFIYLVSLRLLEDARWAGIAALLAMQGSIMFSRMPFYPGTMGLVFASTYVLLALVQGGAMFARPSYVLSALVLLAASTITHLVTPMLLLFLVGGIWLVRYDRRSLKEPLPTSTLLLYAVVPFAWLIYATVLMFGGMAHMVTEFADNIQRELYLRSALITGGSNFGVAVPLWARTVKLFWIFLLFGAGTAAALLRLRRRHSLRPAEAKAVGALLGILLLSVTIGLVSAGGLQLFRYVMYAPLVLAPLLLLSIRHLPWRLGGVGLGALAVSLVALAVPTFFAHYPTVRTEMFYAYEIAPAQTLGLHDDGSKLLLIAPAAAEIAYVHYLPDAEFSGTPVEFTLTDKDGVWAFIDGQVDLVMCDRCTGKRVILYVLSNRPRVYYKHNFGIPLGDPRWDAVRIRLEERASIYDNGFVTLYEGTAPIAPEEVNASRR